MFCEAIYGRYVRRELTADDGGASRFETGVPLLAETAAELVGACYSGYYVAVSATGAWTIIRIDNGASVTLASGVTQAISASDKIGIRIVGSTVTALHYTTAAGWVQVLTLQHQLGRRPLHHSRSPGPRVQDQHPRRLRRRNAAVTNARARLGECDEARRTASGRASSAENRDRHRAV